ncbi:MAG: WXG100 family type VII secretion target [Mycolicibacterium cosmeticum]|nr:WXG100 family type VII secretion target [Mycolicibacterium cosmeticum]
MSGELHFNTENLFDACNAIGSYAEDLRDELARLSREWDNLSHSWSGTAASAFSPAWDEWHQGAAKIVELLAETARNLALAATSYGENDSHSASALADASAEIGH